MLFLDLLGFCSVVLLLYLLISQVFIPGYKGLRFFPAFRNDPLVKKVEATRDLVHTLKDQNQNLNTLENLLKQQKDLEAKIRALEMPQEPATEVKQPKE